VSRQAAAGRSGLSSASSHLLQEGPKGSTDFTSSRRSRSGLAADGVSITDPHAIQITVDPHGSLSRVRLCRRVGLLRFFVPCALPRFAAVPDSTFLCGGARKQGLSLSRRFEKRDFRTVGLQRAGMFRQAGILPGRTGCTINVTTRTMIVQARRHQLRFGGTQWMP
jgi:hypothetical protein